MRKEKGITLIALIITIIILLILAVVTMSSIKNSNIITYAQNASVDYEDSKAEEKDIISQYEDLISVGLYKQTGPLGEARNIENYGKKVSGFQSKGEGLEDIVWRVFYQDDKNVYLISERVDAAGKKYYPIEKSKLYKIVYDEDGNLKEDPENLKEYTSGADTSIQGQELMLKAKEANLFNIDNKSPNIRATAYMCDINVWKEYTDAEGKATWAMGSPTIELYEKSFNAVKGEVILASNISEKGYETLISGDEKITTERNEIYRFEGDILIYNGNGIVNAWYLASPSVGAKQMCGIHKSGSYVGITTTTVELDGKVKNFALRPIVCIPVSNFDYELE